MKLQSQFALAFVPVLLVSGLGTTYMAKRAVHRTILESVAARGYARLTETASATAPGFQAASEAMLLPTITSILAKENTLYVMALDPQGRVLAHTNVIETGKIYGDATTHAAIASDKPTFREVIVGGQDTLDVTWPVWTDSLQAATNSEEFLLAVPPTQASRRRLGTLRMGYALGDELLTEAKISKQLTILLLCTSALLLGFAMLLMRNVLLPVGRLIQATDRIGSGDYGATVPIPSALELAALATSFNRMSTALSQTTVSKDFLDTILSNMLHPLIVLEADGRIRMINRAALDLLDYQAGDLLDKPFLSICKTAEGLMEGVARAKSLRDRQVEFQTRSNTAIPVLFAGSSFEDKDGKMRGVIVVAEDIRERLKLEREMVQSAKLSAVGKLASGVAHEINNPLGVILGFTEGILFDVKPGDAIEGPLREIERETIRCRNLVQDLLTFSRVSRTEREPMDLNRTVESALSLVYAQARLRKTAVVKDLGEGLPHILGTPNQVQQVIINLANNALDAMGNEGTLTVRTRLVEADGRHWIALSVSDTGSGIPAEVLPRIFEPFFTTKPVGKGTGLGLGLVAEIVQKHSATISVESRPGNTEFTVRFPAPTQDK